MHGQVEEIGMDCVLVYGQKVARPASVGRIAWLEFWEAIVDPVFNSEREQLEERIEELQDKVNDLESEVEGLREETVAPTA